MLKAECLLTLLLVQGLCALSQNGNGHSGIPRHLHTSSCIHPSGGIVGELWECEPFRYQQKPCQEEESGVSVECVLGGRSLHLDKVQTNMDIDG